jgi:hypothetical protein
MTICGISDSTRSRCARVSALVDGAEVWFETSDAEFSPSGEAFGTAFLIPALHAERRLRIAAPTDGLWARNIVALAATIARWWATPECMPAAFPALPRQPKKRTGLFFTGGVDSFFSLLENREDIDVLVHVQGFDIPFSDPTRLASAEEDTRSIAADLDLECIVVRTNLRSHPAYEAVSWERTHGGALISIAHLLREAIGRVFISSSAHRSATRPWGSDRRIDAYWSSTSLAVSHTGDELWRHQKLERIVHHPLVRRYLRVCWEHLSPRSNCSVCDKCVRTMLTLNRAGALAESERFESGSLAERIDALPVAHGPANRREYMVMLEDEDDPAIARALSRLLERSPAPSPVDDL